MNRRLCRTISVLGGVSVAASAHLDYEQGLAVPTGVEAHPPASGKMLISWNPAVGATSYNIYRSTTAGGEGTPPIGSTPLASSTDTPLTTGPPTLYYYQVAAVNGGTVSPQSAETVSPTPLKTSPGSGTVAGVPVTGGSLYYGKDGLANGFDWFNATASQCINCPDWFPQQLTSQAGALAPGGTVVDMAYADTATLTWSDVVVPSTGLYNIEFRYDFGPGLFPTLTNREMGRSVNGSVITLHMRSPITRSFSTYQHAVIQAQLLAGQNSIEQFAITAHGISRVDELTVTSPSGSSPSEPTNLTGVAGNGQVALSWPAGSGAAACNVYRGTVYDGEAQTPIPPVTGKPYTDT